MRIKAELTLEEKIKLLNKIIKEIKSHDKNANSYYICIYLEDKEIIEKCDSKLIKPIFPELYEVIVKKQNQRKKALEKLLSCFTTQHKYPINQYKIGAWTCNKERLAAMEELKKKIQNKQIT